MEELRTAPKTPTDGDETVVDFFKEASRPPSILKSAAYHFTFHSPIPMVETYLSTCNITSLLARLWR